MHCDNENFSAEEEYWNQWSNDTGERLSSLELGLGRLDDAVNAIVPSVRTLVSWEQEVEQKIAEQLRSGDIHLREVSARAIQEVNENVATLRTQFSEFADG